MDSSALIWCDVNSLARLSCLTSFALSSSRMTSRLRWKKNCFVMTWKSIVLTTSRSRPRVGIILGAKERMCDQKCIEMHLFHGCVPYLPFNINQNLKSMFKKWALKLKKNREFNHLISRNFFKNYVKENFVVFELWTKNKIKKVSWNQFY